MGMQTGGRGKQPKVTPDMNVTPLVDVVLVLLIIFMVLAPVLTESFGVRLPPRDDKDAQLDRANDLDKPLVLTVTDDGVTEINSVAVESGELADRLRRMFNARVDNVLYVDGAEEVPYGLVISAVELARKGGAGPVVMITKKLE